MQHPLETLLRLGSISKPQFDAGMYYAATLTEFRTTRSDAAKRLLETIRQVTWTKTEPGHAFRLIVGIAGNGECWKCVLDAAKNDYPRTRRQLTLLREGLQRIADYQNMKKAA